MVLDKTIIIKWNPSNKSRFKNLGYMFTELKEEFEVKVSDLSPSSHYKVNVSCELCGCIKKLCLRDYYANDVYYCRSCTSKLHNEATAIKNIQEGKTKSFATYLTDVFGKGALEIYWSSENVVDPNLITYASNKNILINCIENPNHNNYLISCHNFVNGRRCGKCHKRSNKNNLDITDSLGYNFKNSILLWGENNDKSPYEYAPGTAMSVWWKCHNNKHGDYKRSILNSKKYNFKCPDCIRERSESFLQEKVRLYIAELGYITKHENDCDLRCVNPKTGHFLFYDNQVVGLNLYIETMGRQHYKPHVFGGNYSDEEKMNKFFEMQFRDEYKKNFILSEELYYLAVPYWTDDKDESYKTLIDNKISEILSHSYIEDKAI